MYRIFSQTVKLTNYGAALTAAAYVLDALPVGVAVYPPNGLTNAADSDDADHSIRCHADQFGAERRKAFLV